MNASALGQQGCEIRVIPEAQFVPLLAGRAQELLDLANGLLEADPRLWGSPQLYHLHRWSTDLETFMDDHGAQRNRRFYPIREQIAVIRWLAAAMGSLIHLLNRVGSYAMPDESWSAGTLVPGVQATAGRIGELIVCSLEAFRESWLATGMGWPDGAHRLKSSGVAEVVARLPQDRGLDPGDVPHHPSEAARLAAHYLAVLKRMRAARPTRITGHQELARIMARYCTETKARSFETQIHNLQSSYDSLLRESAEEKEDLELRRLRGSISAALHLAEAITALAHTYERHLAAHAPETKVDHFLSEEKLLDITINDCALITYRVLSSGESIAARIVERFSQDASMALALPSGVTLHARPVSLVVTVVNHYKKEVYAEIDGDRCNASSIMQMLVLAGSHPDAQSVKFHGDREPLEDLRLLFEANLGEKGLDALPEQLHYLRA